MLIQSIIKITLTAQLMVKSRAVLWIQNTIYFDPDPGFWPNLDPHPGPDPNPGLYYQF